MHQPAVQGDIEIIEKRQDIQFQVGEVFGIERQEAVLRVAGFANHILFGQAAPG